MPRDYVSGKQGGYEYDRTSSRHRLMGSHQLDPSGGIVDGNGNELLTFELMANAANHLAIGNTPTGLGPVLGAVGDDTNVRLNLLPKGTENVYANRLYVGDADDTTSPSMYLGVGNAQDGMLFSTGDDVYLDARTSDKDLFIRANDGGTMKTFAQVDASEALLKLGYDTESDVIIGVDGQSSVTELRPSVSGKVNLGSGTCKFHDGYFDGDVGTDTVTGTSGVYTVASEYDSSSPPTAADLNAAFGGGLADGFIGILNDNGGDADVRFAIRSNGSWFISPVALTQKV